MNSRRSRRHYFFAVLNEEEPVNTENVMPDSTMYTPS